MLCVGQRSSLRVSCLLVVVAFGLSACSSLFPTTDEAQPVVVVPQLPPTPILVPETQGPEVKALPAPPPVVEEAPPPAEPVELKVAIVLSSRVPAYADVAVALGERLADVDIYDLSDKSLTQKDAFDAIHDSGAKVVVAVGLRAATFAGSISELPVVFSQVFNVSDSLTGSNLKGVAAIPPLEMQLQAWREINPGLRNIGAIVGEGHDRLIDEAVAATEATDLHLHYRYAKSDRETLYIFTRLVPDIDGFWLFPDNRILSASILREMLSYATRHNVQVAVFNDSLLTLGAAISATSVNADIAQTIVAVIDELTDGNPESVPAMTPLSQIDIVTNPALAQPLARDDSVPFVEGL
jgi:ABC-type uncharacterized transport system substrate-binding protein